MFFVLTTGRSGSKSIAKFLSLSDKVVCLHEPAPVLVEESRKYLSREYDHDKLVKLLRETRKPCLEGKEYGESNNRLSFIIPALIDAFEDCKFIWLVRDGRKVVNSYYARGRYDEKFRNKNIFTKNWIEAPQVGDMNLSDWQKMDSFSKCCWYWSFTNKLIHRHLSELDEHKWIMLRIEDINDSINDINKFLSINKINEPFPWINIKKPRKKATDWHDWSDNQKSTFKSISGDMMDSIYPEWEKEYEREQNLKAKLRKKLTKYWSS